MAAPALPASVAAAFPSVPAAIEALHSGNAGAGPPTALALAEVVNAVHRIDINLATLAGDNVQAHDRIDASATELRHRHDVLQGLHDELRRQHDSLEQPLNQLTMVVGEVAAEGSAVAGGASTATATLLQRVLALEAAANTTVAGLTGRLAMVEAQVTGLRQPVTEQPVAQGSLEVRVALLEQQVMSLANSMATAALQAAEAHNKASKVDALEAALRSNGGGLSSTGASGPREPLGTMRAFTQRVEKLDAPGGKFKGYREWASTFKDVANMKPYFLDVILWAEAQGDSEIDCDRPLIPGVTADVAEISRELFDAIASAIKGPELIRIKDNTPRGRGLELWRRLFDRSHITGEEHADVIENSLSDMKPVPMEGLKSQIEIIDDTIRRHDEMANEGMKESTKRLAIMRVLPKECLNHITAQGHISTYADLRSKVLTWVKRQESMGVLRGDIAVNADMDLGALGNAGITAKAQSPDIAELRAQMAALQESIMGQSRQPVLGAMNRPSGQFNGTCFKCGLPGHMARDCRNPPVDPLQGSGDPWGAWKGKGRPPTLGAASAPKGEKGGMKGGLGKESFRPRSSPGYAGISLARASATTQVAGSCISAPSQAEYWPSSGWAMVMKASCPNSGASITSVRQTRTGSTPGTTSRPGRRASWAALGPQ